MYGSKRVAVRDLNPHILCALCGGYLIQATTVIECLHSFCRSCIVNFLETSKVCPICDAQIHKTRPLLNIRPDQTLQNLVYKLVPGLFQDEMRRRREFHATLSESDVEELSLEERGEASLEREFKPGDDHISLILQMVYRKNERKKFKVKDNRYLLCPSEVTIKHLKKFLRYKFDLTESFKIQMFRAGEELTDDLMLQDIALIYSWRGDKPMRICYTVRDKSKAVNKKPITEQVTDAVKIQPISEQVTDAKKIQPISEQVAKAVKIQPITEQVTEAVKIQPISEHVAKTVKTQPISEQVTKVDKPITKHQRDSKAEKHVVKYEPILEVFKHVKHEPGSEGTCMETTRPALSGDNLTAASTPAHVGRPKTTSLDNSKPNTDNRILSVTKTDTSLSTTAAPNGRKRASTSVINKPTVTATPTSVAFTHIKSTASSVTLSATPIHSSATPFVSSATPPDTYITINISAKPRSSTSPGRTGVPPKVACSSSTPAAVVSKLNHSAAPVRSSATPIRSTATPTRSTDTPTRSTDTLTKTTTTPTLTTTPPATTTAASTGSTPTRTTTTPTVTNSTPSFLPVTPARSVTTSTRTTATTTTTTTFTKATITPAYSTTAPTRPSTTPASSFNTPTKAPTTPTKAPTTPMKAPTTPILPFSSSSLSPTKEKHVSHQKRKHDIKSPSPSSVLKTVFVPTTVPQKTPPTTPQKTPPTTPQKTPTTPQKTPPTTPQKIPPTSAQKIPPTTPQKTPPTTPQKTPPTTPQKTPPTSAQKIPPSVQRIPPTEQKTQQAPQPVTSACYPAVTTVNSPNVVSSPVTTPAPVSVKGDQSHGPGHLLHSVQSILSRTGKKNSHPTPSRLEAATDSASKIPPAPNGKRKDTFSSPAADHVSCKEISRDTEDRASSRDISRDAAVIQRSQSVIESPYISPRSEDRDQATQDDTDTFASYIPKFQKHRKLLAVKRSMSYEGQTSGQAAVSSVNDDAMEKRNWKKRKLSTFDFSTPCSTAIAPGSGGDPGLSFTSSQKVPESSNKTNSPLKWVTDPGKTLTTASVSCLPFVPPQNGGPKVPAPQPLKTSAPQPLKTSAPQPLKTSAPLKHVSGRPVSPSPNGLFPVSRIPASQADVAMATQSILNNNSILSVGRKGSLTDAGKTSGKSRSLKDDKHFLGEYPSSRDVKSDQSSVKSGKVKCKQSSGGKSGQSLGRKSGKKSSSGVPDSHAPMEEIRVEISSSPSDASSVTSPATDVTSPGTEDRADTGALPDIQTSCHTSCVVSFPGKIGPLDLSSKKKK
ncbi:mucin-2-like [Physella acuta]|uniref:mucin-2-like n=1 Tax=Physella acuta TaxID=109671 RepID=UPI0027DB8406|nr:mucin-2-like [Physella acuta]